MRVVIKSLLLLALLSGCANETAELTETAKTSPSISSIFDVSIPALRSRSYGSEIGIITQDKISCIGENQVASLPDLVTPYKSYMAAFRSDGIRQYARITVPDIAPPENGHPVVLFLHGWVGMENAPSYSIGCDPSSMYAELTDAFARAGFAVLAPGYRGHGTIDGVPAEGLEYLEAYDQGAGLSTSFYAVDTLNFMAGMTAKPSLSFGGDAINFDMKQINLAGHSQGGDVGLIYLAATGEGVHTNLSPAQSALWAGTFIGRLDMLTDLFPVEKTPQAFLSGDGSWTGTAIGADGTVNANFVFGFPPDYIGSPDPEDWEEWQKKSWSITTVRDAAGERTQKMYADLAAHVDDIDSPEFEILDNSDGSFEISHDPTIKSALANIGGYNFAQFLTEPLTLHTSDQDFYSQPKWNENLCVRANGAGGNCQVFIYPGNTHGMRRSPHAWFSPKGTVDGYAVMMSRYYAQFSGRNPARIPLDEMRSK